MHDTTVLREVEPHDAYDILFDWSLLRESLCTSAAFACNVGRHHERSCSILVRFFRCVLSLRRVEIRYTSSGLIRYWLTLGIPNPAPPPFPWIGMITLAVRTFSHVYACVLYVLAVSAVRMGQAQRRKGWHGEYKDSVTWLCLHRRR